MAEERLGELTRTNTDLQRQLDTERAAWLNDKKTPEDTIVDLSTAAQTIQTDRSTWELEIHRQEERAKVRSQKDCLGCVDAHVGFRPRRSVTRRRSLLMLKPLRPQTSSRNA